MNHLSYQFVLSVTAVLCAVAGALTDIAWRRIPNVLTGPAMLLGLVLHGSAGGWRECLSSFIALILCGFIFLIFYLAGGMGAGDVKLIAAEGCLLGISNSGSLLVLTAIAGGVLAVGYAWRQGQLRQTCTNVLTLACHHREQGLMPHPELNVQNANALRLPYGLAIAAGSLLTLYLQAFQVYP